MPKPFSVSPRVQGLLLMICAAALIAATSLMAKALGRGLGGPELHPLQVSAGRFCFAFATLIPIVLWVRPSFANTVWPLHIGRSVSGWIGVSFLFAAAAQMPLAEANAISFLSPIVTMALSIPFLGERVGPRRWGAAAIALLGAMVLTRPGTEAFQPAALIAAMSALFMGIEVIFIKKLTNGEPPLRILAINNGIGATISLIAASFFWITPSPAQWLVLIALGMTMVTAQFCFIQSMRRADASFVIPLLYATPVFAAIYDFELFDQPLTAVSALGIALIICGALILVWREKVAKSGG
jgi:drug/metabolite transporter (DMT)-like permease